MNRRVGIIAAAVVLAVVAAWLMTGDKPNSSGVSKRTWSFATLEGVPALSDVALPALSDIAVLDGQLYAVGADNKRIVYAGSLAALRNGGTLALTPVDIKINATSPISGTDPFAFEGYNIGHLWDLPVSFVGIAVRPPNRLYLAERNHRLIYWGDLVRGADSTLMHARLDWAYTLRGGDRSDAHKSDWRDKSDGLIGVAALQRTRRTEDLYALDYSTRSPELAGLRRLDRTGGQLGATIRIAGADGKRPDLRSVVWETFNERFLALVGGGRGALVPFKDPGSRMVVLKQGTPGPKADGVTGWTAMTTADDGRLFLLSEGSPVVIAWRAPETKRTIRPR